MSLTSLLLWFSCSVMSDSLQPQGLHNSRLPCSSPTPISCSNSCPLSRGCHPTISSSVILFSSWPQSLTASGSFQMSQFSSQQVAKIVELQLQYLSFQWIFRVDFLWDLIFLQSKGLLRVFSSTTFLNYIVLVFCDTYFSSECISTLVWVLSNSVVSDSLWRHWL